MEKADETTEAVREHQGCIFTTGVTQDIVMRIESFNPLGSYLRILVLFVGAWSNMNDASLWSVTKLKCFPITYYFNNSVCLLINQRIFSFRKVSWKRCFWCAAVSEADCNANV